MQQVVNVQQPVITPRRFKVYQHRQLDKIEALKRIPDDIRFEMKVVANVLPFRVNIMFNETIDWENVLTIRCFGSPSTKGYAQSQCIPAYG